MSGKQQRPANACYADDLMSVDPMMSVDPGLSAQDTLGNAAIQEQLKSQKGIAALDAGHPASEVDDQQVGAILQDLYRRNQGLEGRDLVQAAWSDAVSLRNQHGQDLNLAAAEHFLYSCGETEGLGSGLRMQLLATGYSGVKALLDAVGQRDLLSTDGSSPTPASAGVYKWGMRGATKACGDLE